MITAIRLEKSSGPPGCSDIMIIEPDRIFIDYSDIGIVGGTLYQIAECAVILTDYVFDPCHIPDLAFGHSVLGCNFDPAVIQYDFQVFFEFVDKSDVRSEKYVVVLPVLS
jgi:hypothetical protein